MDSDLSYAQIVKRRWWWLVLGLVLGIGLSAGFTFLQDFEYEGRAELLIIQRSDQNVDAYTAARAAERIGNNLVSVVHSSSFFSKVEDQGVQAPLDVTGNAEKIRQWWEDRVQAELQTDTGIITVKTYSVESSFALELVEAVTQVYINNGEEYHGAGDGVILRLIDNPQVSDSYVRPNVLLNLALGGGVGLFGILALLVMIESFRSPVMNPTSSPNASDVMAAPVQLQDYPPTTYPEVARQFHLGQTVDDQNNIWPGAASMVTPAADSGPTLEAKPTSQEPGAVTMYDLLEKTKKQQKSAEK